jgi:hypothetical protein
MRSFRLILAGVLIGAFLTAAPAEESRTLRGVLLEAWAAGGAR